MKPVKKHTCSNTVPGVIKIQVFYFCSTFLNPYLCQPWESILNLSHWLCTMDSQLKGVYSWEKLQNYYMELTMSSKSLALIILSLFSSLGWSQSCENLLSKSIPNASIKESHIVMAGEFDAPGGGARSRGIYDELPEFCRVSLLLTPSPAVSYTHLTLPTKA